MLHARLRGLRRGTTFTVRFAVILAVLGVLIALATAAIPVQLAADEAHGVALDRAADKGGIAVNLIAAQRASLDTFVRGIANQLSGPLGVEDRAGAAAILQRESAVTDSNDIVGDGIDSIWRNGSQLASSDAAGSAAWQAVQTRQPIAVSRGGTPWLVEQVPIPGVSGTVVFIARPMQASFVDRLTSDLGGGADAASLALVRDGSFVNGSTASGGAVHRATRVPATYGAAAGLLSGAVLVHVDGTDVAASLRPLGDGVSLLVTTSVSTAAGSFSTVLGPVAVIAVAMILLAMTVVFVVVQRDLARPLRRLDRAVAALEREDFDVPIPAGNDDELGRLGRSFERMRRTLRATLAGAEARAEVATELNSPQPLQKSLQSVCAALRRTIGARAAIIAVDHSDMADAFAVVDGLGVALDADHILTGGGPVSAAHSSETQAPLQAVALDGTEEARAGLHDVCAAPLRIGVRVLGALAVADKTGEPFNAADMALVSAAAEQVSLALERYRVLADAQHQASTDELTGLYNYRFLVDYLDQQIALAERLDSPLAVLMLDLDRFKALNDRYGHHAGDEALRRFAEALRDTVRRADLAARYGGEEFVVVMANTNREEARLVAEKIRRAVAAQRMLFEGEAVGITVSIGGVAYPDDTGDARQLLHLADAALYRAKRGGRDRVFFVSDGPRRRTLARAGAVDTAGHEDDDDEHQLTGHRPAQ